jgi:hypothetical protein
MKLNIYKTGQGSSIIAFYQAFKGWESSNYYAFHEFHYSNSNKFQVIYQDDRPERKRPKLMAFVRNLQKV